MTVGAGGRAGSLSGPGAPASPWWTAQAAISARERGLSLSRMCEAWVSAVLRLITSRSAISRLVSPWAIREATSTSRSESPPGRLADRAPACAANARVCAVAGASPRP